MQQPSVRPALLPWLQIKNNVISFLKMNNLIAQVVLKVLWLSAFRTAANLASLPSWQLYWGHTILVALSSLRSFIDTCCKSVEYFDVGSVGLCWKAVTLRYQTCICASIALSRSLRLPAEGRPAGKLKFSRELQIKQSLIFHALYFKLLVEINFIYKIILCM
jgi:hypothetical protein